VPRTRLHCREYIHVHTHTCVCVCVSKHIYTYIYIYIYIYRSIELTRGGVGARDALPAGNALAHHPTAQCRELEVILNTAVTIPSPPPSPNNLRSPSPGTSGTTKRVIRVIRILRFRDPLPSVFVSLPEWKFLILAPPPPPPPRVRIARAAR